LRYPYIIGDAWGTLPDSEGVQHHWTHIKGVLWRTDCAEGFETVGFDEFGGLFSITVDYDPEGEFCVDCSEVFLQTPTGKHIGIRPPYHNRPGGKDV
jgi:hypothetical protein